MAKPKLRRVTPTTKIEQLPRNEDTLALKGVALRRRGLRCIQVQVGRAELDGLVAEGYVLRGDGDNIARIALAINDRNSIGSMVRSPRLLGPVAANGHSRRRGRLPFTSS